jgi:hypothetical protein
VSKDTLEEVIAETVSLASCFQQAQEGKKAPRSRQAKLWFNILSKKAKKNNPLSHMIQILCRSTSPLALPAGIVPLLMLASRIKTAQVIRKTPRIVSYTYTMIISVGLKILQANPPSKAIP